VMIFFAINNYMLVVRLFQATLNKHIILCTDVI